MLEVNFKVHILSHVLCGEWDLCFNIFHISENRALTQAEQIWICATALSAYIQCQAAQRSGLSAPSWISLMSLPQTAGPSAGQTTRPRGDLQRRGCSTVFRFQAAAGWGYAVPGTAWCRSSRRRIQRWGWGEQLKERRMHSPKKKRFAEPQPNKEVKTCSVLHLQEKVEGANSLRCRREEWNRKTFVKCNKNSFIMCHSRHGNVFVLQHVFWPFSMDSEIYPLSRDLCLCVFSIEWNC